MRLQIIQRRNKTNDSIFILKRVELVQQRERAPDIGLDEGDRCRTQVQQRRQELRRVQSLGLHHLRLPRA